MDSRLFKAAKGGDINELHALLEEDELALHKVALLSSVDTPLHIATLAGKTDFAREVVNKMPSFAWVRNKDGFTPLHIASANGDVDIVREILKIKPDTCLIKDKGGRTSLHYATIWGRVDVVDELLTECPQAGREVTANGETVLHLAVINSQFEALKLMVMKLDDENLRELINAPDNHGNTILQMAKSTKQLEVIKLLSDYGMTRKETIDQDGDEEQQGVITIYMPDQDESNKKTMSDNNDGTVLASPGEQGVVDKQDQSSSHSRHSWGINADMIPVVVGLMAQVTYQAGLSPPPTIWKENMKMDASCFFSKTTFSIPAFKQDMNEYCPAATYYIFMGCNTAGFILAMCLIVIRDRSKGAKTLLPATLFMMVFAYASLISSMSSTAQSLLIILLVVLVIIFFMILVTFCWRKASLVKKRLANQLLERKKARAAVRVSISNDC